MKKEMEIAVQAAPPTSMLEVIGKAVADPRMDVEKMRALFELQKDILAAQHKILFKAALAQLQADIPQVSKLGQGKNSKFAKLQDIHRLCQPLLAKHGFAMSFDEESSTDKVVVFVAALSHEAGHSETKRLTVPIDAAAKNSQGNSIRPAIQDMGSTVSYARRYLYKMHLNIIEKDEDTDGEPARQVSSEQAKDLEASLSTTTLDKGKFFVFMGVGAFDEILEKDLKKAINAIDYARRNPK